MPEYVLGHDLKGEGKRLALMSNYSIPCTAGIFNRLMSLKSGARTLEVGCGNGSISARLARQVAPDGQAIAVDLDLSLVDVHLPNLEFRKEDIMAQPVEPGGAILLIEPDFLSVTIAEPPEVHALWEWLACMVT